MPSPEYSIAHLFLSVLSTLVFFGVGVWYFTRASQKATEIVCARVEAGYPVPDHAGLVAKYRRLIRISSFGVMVISILGALLYGNDLVRCLWQ